MPLSHSVLRRYTPPTCTLEVLAQSSPLSRWMGKSVVKQLGFELRFDDPRLPEENRIAISGDRNQLEALCAAVTNYVQQFLQSSPEDFWETLSSNTGLDKPSDEPQSTNFNNSSQPNTFNPFDSHVSDTEIHLEPSSGLTHNLFLGSLANQTSGPAVKLGLLQLFDLATALDEFSADVIALPSLSNPTRANSSWPAWAPAAAVLLLAVGLTPLTLQYANRSREKRQAETKSSTAQQKVALQSSPSPAVSPTTPPLNPPSDILSPSANSPTSPITGQASPNPPVPTQASQVSPGSGGFPTASKTSPDFTLPADSLPSPGSSLTVPQKALPNLSTNQAQTGSSTPNKPQLAQPNLGQTGTGSIPQTSSLPNSPPNLPTLAGGIPPSNSTLPGNLPAIPNTNRGNGGIPPIDSTLPGTLPAIPNTNRGNVRGQANLPGNTSMPTDANPLATKLRQGRKNPQGGDVATNTTLFDTAQVAEAREYFKKKWRPPADLRQALEYSLVVGVDGSMETILPLGKAARDYVERTGMPPIGERFVSPNKRGQAVRIRAIFGPDGKVQAFPETD